MYNFFKPVALERLPDLKSRVQRILKNATYILQCPLQTRLHKVKFAALKFDM